jgi:hypothetical protein
MAANIPDSTPQPQPAPPHRDAGYGVVEPTDGRGRRIVAWGATEACAIEVCAVLRKHGHRPTDTSSFITESKPH